MNLNWLDFVIIILVVLSAAEGIRKGFARTGIGFASAILGVVLATWFYGVVGAYLTPFIKSESIAHIIGFLTVFSVCLAIGAAFGALLAYLLKWAGLTFIDRFLGALVGVLRGAVAAVVLVLILTAFTPEPPPRSVVESYWAPYLIEASNVVAELAPRELKDTFFESYDKVRNEWNKHNPEKHLKLPQTEI